MPLKVKKSKTFHVDEGEYTAIVSGIEEKEGKHGPYYIWKFMVKGATHDGEPIDSKKVIVTGLSSDTFSAKSKLYKWAKGCGLDVEADELDLEDAIKNRVRVYLEDDEDADGNIWTKVVKVRKALKRKAGDEEEEEEEEVEDKPKDKKKAGKKKAAKEEDEDDEEDEEEEEDEDDEEDEAPPPKKKKDTKKKAAPKKKKEEDEEEEDSDDDNLFDFDDDDDD